MRERKSRSRERKSSWWFSTPSSSDSLPFCFFSYRSPPLLTLTVFFSFFSIFLGVFYPSSLDFPGNERWGLVLSFFFSLQMFIYFCNFFWLFMWFFFSSFFSILMCLCGWCLKQVSSCIYFFEKLVCLEFFFSFC